MPNQDQGKSWFVTVFNESESAMQDHIDLANEVGANGFICKEVAPTTGAIHYHILITFKKKQRFNAVCKWFGKVEGNAHPNVQKTLYKQAATEYVNKYLDYQQFGNQSKGKRNDIAAYRDAIIGGATDLELARDHASCYARYGQCRKDLRRAVKTEAANQKSKTKYENAKLKRWQRIVIEDLLEQDDREVMWIWDAIGNVGKSWLAGYLECKHNAFVVEQGKKNDIAHAYDYEPIVCFDLTRMQSEHMNYSTIENFKNGRIFSGKYDSGVKRFDPCKVVVFANWEPDESKLSADRWDIREITKKNRIN